MPYGGIKFAGHVRAGKVCCFARIKLSSQTIISAAERPSETGEWLPIPADRISMAEIQFPAQDSGKREDKFASLVHNVGAI